MHAAHLEGETLADRIGIVKDLAHQGLVDDDDGSGRGRVAIREVAAFDELNAHRAEVARARRLKERCRRGSIGARHRIALGDHGRLGAAAFERNGAVQPDAVDAGQHDETLQDLAMERGPGGAIGILRVRQIQPGGDDAFGIEAGIDRHQPAEAAQREAGADQQHHGQRPFDDDERGADAA